MVVISALVFHCYFICLVLLCVYWPFKSVSFNVFETLKPFIFGLYFCLLIIVSLYFELWLRLTLLLFGVLFLCYLKITNTSKEQFLDKVLPSKISRYLSSYSNSDLILENHFVKNTPLVKHIRTATLVFAVSIYLFCRVYPFNSFFDVSPKIFAYMLNTLLLQVIYVFLFTLYLIWCTNTPEVSPWLKTTKAAVGAGLVFLGVDYNTSLRKDTVEDSHLPSMFKYISQDMRQTPWIIGDRYDRLLDPIVISFTTRYPGAPFAYDPDFPLRFDYGSYVAADKAFMDGKSTEEVKSILYRNSERAAKSHYHSIPRRELLLMPVPERFHLLQTEEELAKEAISKKPSNFTNVVCNPHFVNINGNLTDYTKLSIHSDQQAAILKVLEKNKKP